MLALDRFFWHKWDDYKVGTYYELDILNTVITCILPAGKMTYINFKLGLNVREG